MFIKINNKTINFNKVYCYYYKQSTVCTKFTLYVDYDATLNNGDIFTFDDDEMGMKIVKRINQLLDVQESDSKTTPKVEPSISLSKADYVKTKWNELAKRYNLAEIKALTKPRIQKLNSRLTEQNMTLEQFFDEIRVAIEDSPFLRGKKWHEIIGHPDDSYWEDADWRADFDFFLQPSSLQKAIEGKYADPTLRKERQRNQK